MWYADDEADDAFCCLGCRQLVPGASVVIGYDPAQVVRLRCLICGQVHRLRELPPDTPVFWIGSALAVLNSSPIAQRKTSPTPDT